MRKVVLTGAASSGKSTLIKAIKKIGYPVIEEVAREVLEERREFSNTLSENAVKQYMMAFRQLQEERKYENNECEIVFLDRSLIDIGYYCRSFTKKFPSDIERAAKEAKYNLVLILERLPFVPDGVRIEKNEEEIIQSEIGLNKIYRRFGYNPIVVPKSSIQGRIDFVLSYVNKHWKKSLR